MSPFWDKQNSPSNHQILSSDFRVGRVGKKGRHFQNAYQMGMDQYLLIPFLVGWTSIYQLFWCSLGTRVLTHPQIYSNLVKPNWTFDFLPSFTCLWHLEKHLGHWTLELDPVRLRPGHCVSCTKTPEASLVKIRRQTQSDPSEPNSLWQGPQAVTSEIEI